MRQPSAGERTADSGPRTADSGQRTADSGQRTAERLTPREVEILALAADGLTDHEIAERLDLSTRTVSNHITHILTKLAATNRTQAVAIHLRK